MSIVSILFLSILLLDCTGKTTVTARENQQPIATEASSALDGGKQSQLNVSIDLIDGSRLNGKIELSTIPLQTSYAFVQLPLESVHSIEFADDRKTVSVALQNNDRMTGKISLAQLKVLTVLGPVSVAVEKISTIRIDHLPAMLSKGLVAYYPFNGNANDESGKDNHGRVHGAQLTADRHGRVNSVYWFNGVNSMVEIPSAPSLNPLKQITITLWMRKDSITDNYSPIIHKGGPQQPGFRNREYSIFTKVHKAPAYYFQVYSAGDAQGQHEVHDSGGASTGEWVFIATVIDRINHVMRFYNNGVLTGQVADSYSSFNNNSFPITLGIDIEGRPPHSPFKGAMDELRIYNRALTGSEIQTLYELN